MKLRMLICLVVAVGAVRPTWCTTPSLWVEPVLATGAAGDTVRVQVFVSAPDDVITGLQFALSFDDGAVTFVSATIGTDLDNLSFFISNVNDDYTAHGPDCGDHSVLVQVIGGATSTFSGSNLEAAVLEFALADQLCVSTPVCFVAACASTQLVTFDLETLCFPAIELTGGAIEGPCISDVPPAATASDVILRQNKPNPFNPQTTIELYLPHPQSARLVIFTPAGRTVRTLLDGAVPDGVHRMVWDGRDDRGQPVATGVYFYALFARERVFSHRMLLLR